VAPVAIIWNIVMKKIIQSVSLCLSMIAISDVALAQETVTNAWVRATVAGQKATGMFATISTTHDVMRLVKVSSDIAAVAQIHEMTMSDGVMRMREMTDGVTFDKSSPLELKPGGYHVMLLDLKRTPIVGEVVTVMLSFESATGQRSDLVVAAEVRPVSSKAMGHTKDHGMTGHGGMTHGEGMKHN
jgi:copper(I)-binding protein